jgi:uncharacterized protein with PIN domain
VTYRIRGCAHHTDHHYRVFGLSCAEFDALLARSGGRCEVCRGDPRPYSERKFHLQIDHDHATGDARVLVCPRCNTGLWFVEKGARQPTPEQVAYLSLPLIGGAGGAA